MRAAPNRSTRRAQTRTAAPDAAQAHYALGLGEQAAGRVDAAIAHFDAALQIRPNFPEALAAGGYILQSRGHVAGALAFYGRAVELKADDFTSWFNMGGLLLAQGQRPQALTCLARACALDPAHAGAAANYGAALAETGQLQEATTQLRRALALNPNLGQAALNLGNALMRQGLYRDAYDSYARALALQPDYLLALVGLGIVAKEMGRFDEAMAAYDRALALDPESVEARGNRGCLQLLLGDFENGWEGYEHRWAPGERPVPSSPARFDLSAPETLKGRRILVVKDHGLGDIIQFFRYVLLLSRAGAQVTFAAPVKLRRLLAGSGAAIDWRDETDLSGDFDAALAISSLPRACATRLDGVPAPIPYLRPEPALRARWRERLAGPGLKVGLCWRGSQDFRVDPRRSIPPEALAPLAGVDGVRLFALQIDVGARELPEALRGRVEVFGAGYDDGPDAFVDTAAVMAELDLVISCDTSTAHLAGALGRPVWLALRHVAEWRWMTQRADSPWYPTMRLFRCGEGDDWRALFETIAGEIARLAAA
jgi:tetratricopeptide (TPR) repeat protein